LIIKEIEDKKYRLLVNKEFQFCQNHAEQIQKKAEKIYKMVTTNRKPILTENSCSFHILEDAYREYIEKYLGDDFKGKCLQNASQKSYDCAFTKGNHKFRFRTGGIMIKDNKMLFVKSNFGNYYYMIGGAVQLGETTEKCIEREVFEEAGIKVQVERLAVVCENFFQGIGGAMDGFDCHTMEFYYLLKVQEDEAGVNKKETDEGEELVWLPMEEIPDSEIKPSFIKEYINEIMNGDKIIHIIWEKDR
jgi:ADP-ribose pyrophosphatase YjhB (NUDIX family)